MTRFFNFVLNITSWACWHEPGMKLIFHWKVQSLLFFKSLFTSFAAVVMSFLKENRDALSANSFALEGRSSNKSFIYIKNNTSPRIEPWGSPTVTFCHSDASLLRTTLCYLSLKKPDKRKLKWIINFTYYR